MLIVKHVKNSENNKENKNHSESSTTNTHTKCSPAYVCLHTIVSAVVLYRETSTQVCHAQINDK